MIEFVVYGTPAPQGSKRFVGMKNGRGILIESSKAVKPWREAVKAAALEFMHSSQCGKITGPIAVQMCFTIKKPTSAPKTRKTWPDKKPDLSKLVRSTEDALVDVGLIEDDARIVSCAAYKIFPGEDPLSLETPGTRIQIWPYPLTGRTFF